MSNPLSTKLNRSLGYFSCNSRPQLLPAKLSMNDFLPETGTGLGVTTGPSVVIVGVGLIRLSEIGLGTYASTSVDSAMYNIQQSLTCLLLLRTSIRRFPPFTFQVL